MRVRQHSTKLKAWKHAMQIFSGPLRHTALQNPKQPQQAAQMSIQCLADRKMAVYGILSKLIHSAKYLALQTVFTFASVLKPGDH